MNELEHRCERLSVQQRLAVETAHEQRVRRAGGFFHIESWYSIHSVIRNALRMTGLYGRARRNAETLIVRHNPLVFRNLPPSFEGFRMLHISDLHVDLNEGLLRSLSAILERLEYDICVLTGDYRGKTYGPFSAALNGMRRLRGSLKGPVFGVLGNHDTLHMLSPLEEMGIRILMNESEPIIRGDERIYLAGVDDAHHHKTHDVRRAASGIPVEAFSILLSHTPALYAEAADADFNLMLSGHTHGGQICLPGAIPILLEGDFPRRIAAGPWLHLNMAGYTSTGAGASVVPLRLNCPAEITLHRLGRG